jgi:hypothetical protein
VRERRRAAPPEQSVGGSRCLPQLACPPKGDLGSVAKHPRRGLQPVLLECTLVGAWRVVPWGDTAPGMLSGAHRPDVLREEHLGRLIVQLTMIS